MTRSIQQLADEMGRDTEFTDVLDVWAGRPGPNYVLMPAPCADEWQRHVTAGRLDEVLRQPAVPGR